MAILSTEFKLKYFNMPRKRKASIGPSTPRARKNQKIRVSESDEENEETLVAARGSSAHARSKKKIESL